MNAITDFELESALAASRASFVVRAFDHQGRILAEYGPILGVHAMRQLADQVGEEHPDCHLTMRRMRASHPVAQSVIAESKGGAQ
ncbi:hypothetical protein A6723_004990 [Pseudomonas sp. AU11447]|uniref:hypothetical protein n=1 Tax=unclassified Pseudomonas TaxID=196821 RepID=UPI0006D48BDB|nr:MULTISPECIES: hypothetical protein [unclassified Pseudomonas]OBY92586.1 hypothetical protein A6723_004990 [Pseudomonas sp. AU11447]